MNLEYHEVFGRFVLAKLLLKYEIVLKSIPSGETGVNPEWIEELQYKKAIGLWNVIFLRDLQTELQQRI